MKIDIVPVDGNANFICEALPQGHNISFRTFACSTSTKKIVEANPNSIDVETFPITASTATVTLQDIFARFLEIEVGDGAASADTIRSGATRFSWFFKTGDRFVRMYFTKLRLGLVNQRINNKRVNKSDNDPEICSL